VAQRRIDVASCHLYREALTTAAGYRNFNVMQVLLESNYEFDLEELTETLNSVCAWGSKEILQLFLKHDTRKVLKIQQYSTGLSKAVEKDNCQIVIYWLEEHLEHHKLVVDPATVLKRSENGSMNILPPLIEHIRSTESFKKTLNQCLQVASKNGHKEVVEYLIGEGADINTLIAGVGYTRGGLRRGSARKINALHAALVGFERFSPLAWGGIFP
jgi:ankyrin repeat protein